MKKIILSLVLVLSLVGMVSAATLQVENTDLTCGNMGDNLYCTINDALFAAVDGDTIEVEAGIYTDDIWNSSLGTPDGYRITKSVTLFGAQAGVGPAGSTDRGGETILVRTNGLPYSLYADNIVIDGFMIGSSDANSGGRLIISGDNVVVRNCIIQNSPDSWAGHGVYIDSGADNALVKYNTFYNTAWEAIAGTGVSNAVITYNHISASGQHAIQMMGHSGINNEISYNHISGIVDKNAIQYWGGSGAIITNNVIEGEGTMYDGIWLDSAADGSVVSHNQISDTIYAGTNIRGGCADAVVEYNDVSGCGTAIENHNGATGALVNYNNIVSNSFGVRNYDSGSLNAEHNWWGTADEGVVTTMISTNVDYDPWLCEESPTDWYSINGFCYVNDNDGIPESEDRCLETGVDNPEKKLGTNRWIWNGDEWITESPEGVGPQKSFTMEDTHGCSCEQILGTMDSKMSGHLKFGCSISVIEDFIAGLQPVLVDSVEVFANNPDSVESSIVLESGVEYELEAMGTAFAGDTIDFDAKYSYTDRIENDDWTDEVSGYESYGTTLLDLFVDGSSVDWGTYNDDHTYYWTLTGTGSPLELLIYDVYYPNNVGSLMVNIYEKQ